MWILLARAQISGSLIGLNLGLFPKREGSRSWWPGDGEFWQLPLSPITPMQRRPSPLLWIPRRAVQRYWYGPECLRATVIMRALPSPPMYEVLRTHKNCRCMQNYFTGFQGWFAIICILFRTASSVLTYVLVGGTGVRGGTWRVTPAIFPSFHDQGDSCVIEMDRDFLFLPGLLKSRPPILLS